MCDIEAIRDEQLWTDAPYFALKDLGEIGQNVIDFYVNKWCDLGMLDGDSIEDNEELAIAYSNLIYYILYDYRFKYLHKKIENVGNMNDFLFELLPEVFYGVNNFNSERFFSILGDIEADYDEFMSEYDDVDVSDDEIEEDFIEVISDLIINEFKRIDDAFENAHDTVEYNYYNGEE